MGPGVRTGDAGNDAPFGANICTAALEAPEALELGALAALGTLGADIGDGLLEGHPAKIKSPSTDVRPIQTGSRRRKRIIKIRSMKTVMPPKTANGSQT